MGDGNFFFMDQIIVKSADAVQITVDGFGL